MSKPVILSSVRTPVGKAHKGTLKNYRPEDLAGLVIKEALKRAEGLKPEEVDDVVMGCATPEGEQGMNMANIAKFAGGLPHTTSAMTINRFCSSGIQSMAIGSDSIAAGRNEVVMAGGVESMSVVPMTGNKIAPNPSIVDEHPEVFMSMGMTAERVAEKYGVTREEQDEFSYNSHMKAIKAIEEKKFEDEIVPVVFEERAIGPDGKKIVKQRELKTDEGPRADTNIETLAKLRTVFKQTGSVTAGNASQLSDGAGCVVMASEEKASSLGAKPIARLNGFSVRGVEPELMGIGPIKAIPKVLELTGLKLDDIGLIELNEAFAAQALAVIKELDINPDIVNVNGGAIALGHPLGATGAILTAKLIHEMKRRDIKYGIVSMCIGGGMGAAGVIESL